MPPNLMYFKSYICIICSSLLILTMNLFCHCPLGHSCCCIILFFVISGFGFHYVNKSRKPIGQKDLIVITGCDSGLGYNLALHCYGNLNTHVIAGVHRGNSRGATDLENVGITVHSLDITQKKSIKKFVQFIKDRLDANNLNLYSVVNNAGTMTFGEFEWQTDEQIHHQINVNLSGTMVLTRALMPMLRLHGSRLIVVTSHCVLEPLPGVAAYSASKAGLAAWSTALRVEVKKYGVDVVNFIPGSFIQDSNILAQQKNKFEMMEAAMTDEAKQFYLEYFRRYSDYLASLGQNVLPKRMKNPQLYQIFEDALLQQYPRSIYKCEPWRYMFYHMLFRISPTYVRDRLIEKFIQMPRWHGNNFKSIDKHSDHSCKILSAKLS